MTGDRQDRRVYPPERGDRIAFTFENEAYAAHAGETVAAALWAAGIEVLRASSRDGKPRGLFCNMGVCFECLVLVDGVPVRACMTPVRDGMHVERGGRR